MVQRKAASIPHILCFLGQHYAHSIQSGAPGRADPPRPPSRGRRDRVSKGPQSTTDGTGGLAHTQEQEESSERSLQKGSARQKVPRASSPIPNESFRHQVQLLALSKARAEALPAPCPLGAGRGHRSSSSTSTASLGADPQQNSFQTSLLFQSRGPTTWKDPRAGKTASHLSLSLLREGLEPE